MPLFDSPYKRFDLMPHLYTLLLYFPQTGIKTGNPAKDVQSSSYSLPIIPVGIME